VECKLLHSPLNYIFSFVRPDVEFFSREITSRFDIFMFVYGLIDPGDNFLSSFGV